MATFSYGTFTCEAAGCAVDGVPVLDMLSLLAEKLRPIECHTPDNAVLHHIQNDFASSFSIEVHGAFQALNGNTCS